MMRRSVIFDTTVRLVFDVALVVSVYMLFAGHNQPGGGFVGGLVAGGAISLRYLTGGFDDVMSAMRFRPWTPLALGLALSSGTALWTLLVGAEPLDQRAYSSTFWALGDVKFTTATVFDTGVYLIVIGLVLMIFEGLAEETDGDHHPDVSEGPFGGGARP